MQYKAGDDIITVMEYQVNDNLKVRPITMDDTDLIVEWRNKPRVKHNFLVQQPFTYEGHVQWMREKVETGIVHQFIMEEITSEGSRPIGSVYIRDIDMEALTAEYGVFIGEDDALGKGYGNAVVEWAVDYARNMGLKKFTLRVLSDNTPALRSYMHAGFVPVFVEKDYIEHRDLTHMELDL